MGIFSKIFKGNNNRDKKPKTDEKTKQGNEFKKTLRYEDQELSEGELDNVAACTPRDHMIYSLPKEVRGENEGR